MLQSGGDLRRQGGSHDSEFTESRITEKGFLLTTPDAGEGKYWADAAVSEERPAVYAGIPCSGKADFAGQSPSALW